MSQEHSNVFVSIPRASTERTTRSADLLMTLAILYYGPEYGSVSIHMAGGRTASFGTSQGHRHRATYRCAFVGKTSAPRGGIVKFGMHHNSATCKLSSPYCLKAQNSSTGSMNISIRVCTFEYPAQCSANLWHNVETPQNPTLVAYNSSGKTIRIMQTPHSSNVSSNFQSQRKPSPAQQARSHGTKDNTKPTRRWHGGGNRGEAARKKGRGQLQCGRDATAEGHNLTPLVARAAT